MKGHRNSIDLAAAILSASRSGATISKIRSEVSLSTLIAKKYINRLVDRGLLTFNGYDAWYVTSVKGGLFLEIYDNMSEEAFALNAMDVRFPSFGFGTASTDEDQKKLLLN